MSTSFDARANLSPVSLRWGRLGGICLALGGVFLSFGGATHPSDSGGGTKVEQLHEAFVSPSWYSSHALLLVAFGLFAAAILLLRTRPDLDQRMARVLNVVSVIAVVATLGMALHLSSALAADSIADGEPSLIYEVQKWNETVLNTLWGMGIIALTLVGGLTRTLGNRITMSLGVVGGVAWCLATATIAFTDKFDPLFKLIPLISIWALAAGVMWTARRPERQPVA